MQPPVGASGLAVGSAMQTAFCTSCGRRNQSDVDVCPNCGSPTDPSDQTAGFGQIQPCPNCGGPNEAFAQFCGACGRPLEAPVAPPSLAPPPSVSTLAGGSTAAMGSIVVTMPDGNPGPAYPFALTGDTLVVGRADGEMKFENDRYMSPRHLQIQASLHGILLTDLGSLNGTYVRLQRATVLADGSLITVGQQVLRVRRVEPTPPYVADDGTIYHGSAARASLWVIDQVDRSCRVREVYALPFPGITIGRAKADVMFPDDNCVSGNHVRLEPQEDGVQVTDQGSSNGTWLKASGPVTLRDPTDVMVGQTKLSFRIPPLGPSA